MNNIFIPYHFRYESVNLPFLDRLYCKWNSNIRIIKKFWFGWGNFYFFLWDIHSRTEDDKKFLYL
jgi:hypothetical protein